MNSNDVEMSASSGLCRRPATSPKVAVRLHPRLGALVLISALALTAVGQTATQDIDSTIKPGADFYHYANGGWLSKVTIPAGQQTYDTRAIMAARTSAQVDKVVQDAAASHAASGSIQQKAGDYYASFMDLNTIESKKLAPLADEMAQISATTDKQSLSAYLGTTLNGEVDGLISNSDHLFGLWINQGFADPDHNVVHFLEGGLGLPDRDNYIDPSPKMAQLRADYGSHLAALLKLTGTTDPDRRAARILSLEVRIAQAFAPDADASDVFKQHNPWKRSDFPGKAPGIDWETYFHSAGLTRQSDFEVWQPSAVTGVSALVASEDIQVWKDYLTVHLLDHYATILPSSVSSEHFAFYGTTLSGAQQPPDRNKLAIAATNAALGQAVAQLYTQNHFPPQAKAKVEAMVADLIAAYRARIPKLTWMSPETRKKAIAKLDALHMGIGYPDTWIDYSALDVARGDALGNMRRAEAFLRSRNLARLEQPVDPLEWPLNPQIPGGAIMFSPNTEFFSAAILQPPYFDFQGDSAANYGSAGAGMAHEISHSFDELGHIYDAQGRLVDWWTKDDRTAYHAAAAKLEAQFAAYCPISGLCVNGKQVLTESIADLAGLLVAHDAYILSLHGKPDAMIGGLTGEQRFFLAFAQRWRRSQTEDALRRQIAGDTHPPGEYRSDTVRNVDAWYKAYDVVPGDKLYLKPEDRVRIW